MSRMPKRYPGEPMGAKRRFLLTARRLLMEKGYKVTIIYNYGPRLVWRKGSRSGFCGILHNTVPTARIMAALRS